MQSVSRQGPPNNLNNQSRTIAFVAILLFALAGLISGFSVGAFVHPIRSPQGNTVRSVTTPPSINKSQGATHTPQPQNFVKLGWPVISQFSGVEAANSSITYMLSAYAVDQSIDPGHGNPVHSSGITFKLWLVKHIPKDAAFILTSSDLKNIGAIQNPLTGTVKGQPSNEISGLIFAGSTTQTFLSNASGKVTWKYQVASSVTPGDYDLIILCDWDGKFYNWSWVNVEITQ